MREMQKIVFLLKWTLPFYRMRESWELRFCPYSCSVSNLTDFFHRQLEYSISVELSFCRMSINSLPVNIFLVEDEVKFLSLSRRPFLLVFGISWVSLRPRHACPSSGESRVMSFFNPYG